MATETYLLQCILQGRLEYFAVIEEVCKFGNLRGPRRGTVIAFVLGQ